MTEIKIRFNTQKINNDSKVLPWRIIIDDVEYFASEVKIGVPAITTEDKLSSGLIKWHISCVGKVVWRGTCCDIGPT